MLSAAGGSKPRSNPAEPDRMIDRIPDLDARGGRIWVEQGDPHPLPLVVVVCAGCCQQQQQPTPTDGRARCAAFSS